MSTPRADLPVPCRGSSAADVGQDREHAAVVIVGGLQVELGEDGRRVLLLPAVMTLLGERNWYLPRWLSWLPRSPASAGLVIDLR
jgi:hypothetical protein